MDDFIACMRKLCARPPYVDGKLEDDNVCKRKFPSIMDASVVPGDPWCSNFPSSSDRRALLLVFAIIPSMLHKERGTVVKGNDKMYSKSRFFVTASTKSHPIKSLVHFSSEIFRSIDCRCFAPSSLNVNSFCFLMGHSNR